MLLYPVETSVGIEMTHTERKRRECLRTLVSAIAIVVIVIVIVSVIVLGIVAFAFVTAPIESSPRLGERRGSV